MANIRVAIVGWGNVGRFCKRVLENTLDMKLVGVVRRASSLSDVDEDLAGAEGLNSPIRSPQEVA